MSRKTRTALAVAAAAVLGDGPLEGQTSLFAGVGFGFAGGPSAPSLFVGASLGLGSRGYGNAYGIYSATYDGWDLGYRGRRHDPFSRRDCWQWYWDSFWDPYDPWFVECVVYGPYRYHSWRARAWRARWIGWYGPHVTFVYTSDPFWPPWGPYWAYDPWGAYWDGFRDGTRLVAYSGYVYPPRVRTVYVAGGRQAASVFRPSPLARPEFKENPAASTVRTAVRRSPGVEPLASPAVAPASRSAPALGTVERPSASASGAPPVAPAPRAAPERQPAVARASPPDPERLPIRTPPAATRTSPATTRTSPATTRTSPPDAPSRVVPPGARPSDRMRAGREDAPAASERAPVGREGLIRTTPTRGTPPEAAPPARRVPDPVPRGEPRTLPRTGARGVPQAPPRAAPMPEPRSAPRPAPQATPRSEPRLAPQNAPRAVPRSEPRVVPPGNARSSPAPAPRVAPQGGGGAAGRRPAG